MNNLFFYQQLCEKHGSPFVIFNSQKLKDNYLNLCEALPNVNFYYAVKSNSNNFIINYLNELGSNFDVASRQEFEYCRDCGISIDKILYTHPIKNKNEISFFKENNIRTFVIDNIYELDKLEKQDNIILRIKSSVTNCTHNLSKKFGCDIKDAVNISEVIRERGMNLIGCCFHVGSQTLSSEPYVLMLQLILKLYKVLEAKGFQLSLIDIGGGFPNSWDVSIDIYKFCHEIRESLKYFEKYKIIAEPGRYLVSDSCELVFSIIGKNYRNKKLWYYVDEGIYSTFADIIYDKIKYPIKSFNCTDQESCVLAGQTCDSIDIVSKDIILSRNLQYGDLLVAKNIGAYSSECSTNFNGFLKTKYIFI